MLGASQAGWLIPMVATREAKVSFAIIRSGPTVTVAQHNFWNSTASQEDLSIEELTRRLDQFEIPEGDFEPRPYLEQMTIPTLWLLGEQDRIIPGPRSAQIVRRLAKQLDKPFQAIVYPGVDHGLRPPGSSDR